MKHSPVCCAIRSVALIRSSTSRGKRLMPSGSSTPHDAANITVRAGGGFPLYSPQATVCASLATTSTADTVESGFR